MPKLLIIDDEPNFVRLTQDILQAYGYEVLPAYTGNEGIAMAREHQPDLILCDIQMPDINGFEVLEALQATEYHHTPFIFLTGLSDRQKMREGMQLGADDYLLKPFSPRDLLRSIEVRLQKQTALKASVQKQVAESLQSLKVHMEDTLSSRVTSIACSSSLLLQEYDQLERAQVLELLKTLHTSAQKLLDDYPELSKPLQA